MVLHRAAGSGVQGLQQGALPLGQWGWQGQAPAAAQTAQPL